MFMGVWAAAWLLMKDKGQVGAFSQASVRSSAAVLGIAFATNILRQYRYGADDDHVRCPVF